MIYPGYKAMTEEDAKRIDKLNARNGWGITCDELRAAGKKHFAARTSGDLRTMEKIEYRLTDINFHHEVTLLNAGDYESYFDEIERN